MTSHTKKDPELIHPLRYSNGYGGVDQITPFGLIILFNSETLCKQYFKEPKKQYTAREIILILEKEFGETILKTKGSERLVISESTIKGYFDKGKYFNKLPNKIIIGERGLTNVCIAEFSSIAKNVFEAVTAARKDLKK